MEFALEPIPASRPKGPIRLDALMRPQSVAIVGASVRQEATGSAVVRNLVDIGFKGAIYPVNPRYDEIAGLPCYPSLLALPEPPDAVFIAVPAEAGVELVEEAGRAGARGVFVNAGGYADGGPDGQARQTRLQQVAAEYGLVVCGPNNVGLINFLDRIAMWTGEMPRQAPGSVAVLTQSGSASFVLSEAPGLDLAYVVTCGNEAVASSADYLDHLVDDPRVRLILMFLETVRDPQKFEQAASRAVANGQRIVALKVGRSSLGRSAVAAHSGSEAGDDPDYTQLFRRSSIIRARDFDELVETAILLQAYPTPPSNSNIVPITGSGGEAALIADLAEDFGVAIRPLASPTIERIKAALPPFSQSARNPLDAYGLGWDLGRFEAIVAALIDDPGVGVIAPWVDAPAQGGGDAEFTRDIARLAARLAPTTTKRFVFVSNAARLGWDADVRQTLEEAHIPALIGTTSALAAIRHWTSTSEGGP
jgi:acyl-CoA synthetase (NDP forming)